MKNIISFLLVIVKIYCTYKIFSWLYLQHYDKVNHPITEIQHLLVFMFFDIWLMVTANQIKNEMDESTV